MDRQPHDYAAAIAFAQQQQQQQPQQQQQQQQMFGFQPHPQQFPPHGPPFIAPHPSLQQFPFPRHLPPQQLHPPHLLHLQQQQPPPLGAFPPHHLPPHMVPPPHFHQSFDSMPAPALAPPPSDPELHKRIDKLVEYAAKNGPEFEAMIRDKQRDNPAYAFLFGAEGHGYYRYKLWLATRQPDGPFGSMMSPSINPMLNPSTLSPAHLGSGAARPASMMGGPQLHQGYPPSYDQHQMPPHSQPYLGPGRGEYEQPPKSFKGLAGPLPSDVAAELHGVLNSLTGTKESIKGAKMWFMQRSPFAPALAEALKERVFATDDSEKQLHIVFLANDILFDSLQRRINPGDLDNEALAFKPVLGAMLARIYHNPHNKDANQSRLEKILQFWASKEVYDQETIRSLESEMTGCAPHFHSGIPETARTFDSTGLQHQATHAISQWQPDKYQNSITGSTDHGLLEMSPPSASQFLSPTASVPAGVYPPVNTALFPGSLPIQASLQAAAQPPVPHILPSATEGAGEQPRPPPYPLFPPGLIPGMVRKMQIGSGVPYSPLSPLDIPTVIPPSTVPQSEILERVSKFFKEIGEVNPSEGPMKSSDSTVAHDDYERDEYERDVSVRKGGACIPPPANLQQVDPETGAYADGSVERKLGSSGRLGLGATADPNVVSQYDDVYSSYRKQRSTSYHSSMSARSATR